MTPTLDLAVLENGRFVRWAMRRPARRLPAGCVGGVFGGKAYPVYARRHEGYCIELSDPGFELRECGYWPSGEDFVFADHDEVSELKWHVETNVFGHYLVFDGDETFLADVLDLLAAGGIGVRRYGESHRPADDGHHYDWFIRLDLDGSRADVVGRLERLLTEGPPELQPKALPAQRVTAPVAIDMPQEEVERLIQLGFDPDLRHRLLSALIDEIEDLSARRTELTEEMERERADFLYLLESTDQARAAAEREARAARAESDRLQAELIGLQGQRRSEAGDGGRLDPTLEGDRLQKLHEELEGWVNLAEEAEKRAREAEQQLAAARTELEQLGLDLQKLKSRRADSRPDRKGQYTIRVVREALKSFSRLHFHADAADVIVERFSDTGKLFSVLRSIDEGDNIGRMLNGLPGWQEVISHISTGCDDRGRVYFRRSSADSIDVYVHWKRDAEEQDAVLKRLPRSDFWGPPPFE